MALKQPTTWMVVDLLPFISMAKLLTNQLQMVLFPERAVSDIVYIGY